MVFKPSLNITEQIADHLADLVIHGQLTGGARIQELKVANELGVSRGSVREALLILERRRLIEIVPRKGAIVSELSGCEAMELVDMLASVEERLFHGLLADGNRAAKLAAAGEHLGSMDGAARAGSVEEVVRARAGFYEALLTSVSRYLHGVFECLLPSSQRLVSRLVERADVDPHDIARYYRALFCALDQGDVERLDELLGAFHRRLSQLCAKTFGVRANPASAHWLKSGANSAPSTATA